VVNSLKGFVETIEEKELFKKKLKYLPLCFDAKVSTIEELKDLENLKMDELRIILISYEIMTINS